MATDNKNDKQSFEQFFAESMDSIIKIGFPTLGKLVDFAGQSKKQDEDRASSSANDAEDNLGTPAKRNKSSQNSVASEMIADGLDAIDQRLKTQSLVLVSSLEEQSKTNAPPSRLRELFSQTENPKGF